MSLVRALWRYLARAARAIRAVVASIAGFVGGLVRSFFEGIIGALERAARKIIELVARLLDLLRTAWLRIWQKAPSTPQDKRDTPGRQVIPLLAAVVTVTIWYLFPLADALDLNSWQLWGALIVTWIASFVVFRWFMRREPPARLGSWLIASQHRTGLIWFERAAFVLLTIGWVMSFGHAHAAPAPLLLALGFLVLMASEYEDRRLTDALPEPVTPLEPGTPGAGEEEVRLEDGANVALRSFRWSVPRATRSNVLDITVAVDEERVETMASTNPKRPSAGPYPDWSPWVVAGSTEEVVRAANEIRKLTNNRGFSRFEEASAVLGFAQSVQYSSDVDSTGEEEYWRYPIETMFEQTGDCEDLSILAAAVLRELGHDVLPLVTHDHAAIGVSAPVGLPGTFIEYDGLRYYYCETTSVGFRIGQLPSDVDPGDLRICPLRSGSHEGREA
jgi:hypothetical protein